MDYVVCDPPMTRSVPSPRQRPPGNVRWCVGFGSGVLQSSGYIQLLIAESLGCSGDAASSGQSSHALVFFDGSSLQEMGVVDSGSRSKETHTSSATPCGAPGCLTPTINAVHTRTAQPTAFQGTSQAEATSAERQLHGTAGPGVGRCAHHARNTLMSCRVARSHTGQRQRWPTHRGPAAHHTWRSQHTGPPTNDRPAVDPAGHASAPPRPSALVSPSVVPAVCRE